ncbi:hypothetical protein N802_04660 [Knoellia sinensis KCTC 19936]|uniref:DUF397 domain-containing protein n=1 Tax=Knoellia sinensis KCTC 19936 TaxID=1385520 RepID=A0A0A0J369_9MICO|nr:DUF397 domain-containing protein [Knoellia sinensis]KGN31134.1 hypothetical protein N802_04660 [Knoellia sinensis KCTC 19936]
MEPNWQSAIWRKSVFSDTGACVEVAHSAGLIGVRDTKAKGEGPILAFTEPEWRAFVGGVVDGEFDFDRLSKSG